MHTYFAHSLILIINLKLIVLISTSLKQYKFLDATIKTININYFFTLFIKILLKNHYLFKRKNKNRQFSSKKDIAYFNNS